MKSGDSKHLLQTVPAPRDVIVRIYAGFHKSDEVWRQGELGVDWEDDYSH